VSGFGESSDEPVQPVGQATLAFRCGRALRGLVRSGRPERPQHIDKLQAKRADRLAKLESKRKRQRAQVFDQLRAAGIAERVGDGGGTPISEPILVFRGGLHCDLEVLDQDANPIGVAAHVRGGSELRDNEGTPLLVVDSVGWFGFDTTYSILRPNGEPICFIGRRRLKLTQTVRVITFHGEAIGCLKLGSWADRASLEDHTGTEMAVVRKSKGMYVAVIAASAGEPVRTVAVAASIIWDLATSEPSG
jgi:hypothetical protein